MEENKSDTPPCGCGEMDDVCEAAMKIVREACANENCFIWHMTVGLMYVNLLANVASANAWINSDDFKDEQEAAAHTAMLNQICSGMVRDFVGNEQKLLAMLVRSLIENEGDLTVAAARARMAEEGQHECNHEGVNTVQ